jgi:cyclohexa-1,5-dienecarbonyl-CoA hydratase
VSDASPIAVERLSDGMIARVRLQVGKGNVLTRAVIVALDEAFRTLGDDGRVRAVALAADGNAFSYGASVPEHAPGEVETMLPAFHRLMRTIASTGLPIGVGVRGRCLGGGLELALVGHHIVAAEDALLGCPEVRLGVFPPVASAVLPLRAAQPVVDRLVVLGETVSGAEALAMGVVDEVAPAADVDERVLAWADRFKELSGAAVRFATRAARAAWIEALGPRLERLEKMYLDELMATADAKEGIAAFLARRTPVWVDR